MDSHAPIQALLQQQSVISLTKSGDNGETLHKAGIVPFIREEGVLHYYVMKPVARHKELAAPEYQLCKGTRMRNVPNVGWRDMREEESGAGEKEPLAVTALREGIEELGLELGNIAKLYELGTYQFASAKSGIRRRMWLFASQMRSRTQFLPDNRVADTTSSRAWLSLAEFDIVGREDHRYILRDIETRLNAKE